MTDETREQIKSMKRLSLIDKRTEFLIKKAYKDGFNKARESEVKDLVASDHFMYNSRKEYIIGNYVTGTTNTVSTFFKVTGHDGLWYGTFNTKELAECYMKVNYPNDNFLINEIDRHGKTIH